MLSEVLLLFLQHLCYTITSIWWCNVRQVIQMQHYAVKHSKTIAVLSILQIKFLHINTATTIGFYSLFQALLLHDRVLQLKPIFIFLKVIPQQIMFLST